MRRKAGMTIVELLFGLVLLSILLIAVYVFIAGGSTQRRHIEGFVDLQRDVRVALLQLQKDLRSLVAITSCQKDEDNTLRLLEFTVPIEMDLTAPVRYAYIRERGILRRNGRDSFCRSISELRIYLLNSEKSEVNDPKLYDTVEAIRVQAKITVKTNLYKLTDKGKKEKVERSRKLDFTIYPRIPVSRSKARQGKLNLGKGRFSRGPKSSFSLPRLQPAGDR